jgi:hypothetical protein
MLQEINTPSNAEPNHLLTPDRNVTTFVYMNIKPRSSNAHWLALTAELNYVIWATHSSYFIVHQIGQDIAGTSAARAVPFDSSFIA